MYVKLALLAVALALQCVTAAPSRHLKLAKRSNRVYDYVFDEMPHFAEEDKIPGATNLCYGGDYDVKTKEEGTWKKSNNNKPMSDTSIRDCFWIKKGPNGHEQMITFRDGIKELTVNYHADSGCLMTTHENMPAIVCK